MKHFKFLAPAQCPDCQETDVCSPQYCRCPSCYLVKHENFTDALQAWTEFSPITSWLTEHDISWSWNEPATIEHQFYGIEIVDWAKDHAYSIVRMPDHGWQFYLIELSTAYDRDWGLFPTIDKALAEVNFLFG